MGRLAAREARDGEEKPRGLLIAGEEVPAASGETLPVLNPVSGTQIARVAAAGPADIDRAVQAADTAFKSGHWSERPAGERARVLNRFADNIERRIEELYRLETLYNGRPITETRAQTARLPEWFRYNAAFAVSRFSSSARTSRRRSGSEISGMTPTAWSGSGDG